MTDTDTPTSAHTPEVWAYAGRRVIGGDKVRYAYFADAGRYLDRPLLFAKPLGAAHRIGCLYDVMVEHKPDGALSVQVGARLVISAGTAGKTDTPHPEWHVADDAAAATVTRKRVESAAKRAGTDLDAVLAPLAKLANSLNTRAERDALISRAVSVIITGTGFRL